MTDDTSSLNIIQATPQHIDLITPLFNAYRQFYKQVSSVGQVRQFVLDRLSNNESVVFLAVAVNNENQQGLGFTQLYPSFSSVSMQRLWILNDLFVAPHARRQRIAVALLERARTFALATHAKGLTLATATDNVSAQRLYEQLGYHRDDEFYHYFLNV